MLNVNRRLTTQRWKDTSDPNIPHPQTFDVVCQLENVSDSSVQDGDFIALVAMEFIVAPTYLHNGDVNKIMNEVSWARMVTFDEERHTHKETVEKFQSRFCLQ